MTTPRPDQRALTAPHGGAGSLSGAGDLAGALGYPGVPAAVPNCKGASLFQRNVGTWTIFTFPAAGRIWLVDMSYVITSNASFSQPTARTVAVVNFTVNASLSLAPIQLGIAGPGQHDSGQKAIPLPGLPVVQGESLILVLNGGNPVTNLDQQASVSVLYSLP